MGLARIRRQLLWLVGSLGTASLVLISALAAVGVKYGSVQAGLAYLRGESLVLLPRSLDLGSAREKETREYRVELVNLTAEPVTVIGARGTCKCLVIRDELPLRLGPHGKHWLAGTISYTGESDDFEHIVTVYSDLPGGGVVSMVIKGQIIREDIITKDALKN